MSVDGKPSHGGLQSALQPFSCHRMDIVQDRESTGALPHVGPKSGRQNTERGAYSTSGYALWIVRYLVEISTIAVACFLQIVSEIVLQKGLTHN